MNILKEKPYIVLGLDIGIGSCGWALLDLANRIIIDMGVRLWDVPQESKTKISKAEKRREERSSRRNIKRNSDRAKHCLNLLIKYGFVPEGVNKSWIQTVKGDPQPLESRAKALDELIDNRHLAQALYNISLRRGYIPHGEGSDSKDSDDKKVLVALKENERIMLEKGYRTVGEMLYRSDEKNPRSRNRDGNYSYCVPMSLLVDEAKKIIQTQHSLGNTLAIEDFENDFIDVMTWEKDVKNLEERIYNSVGHCVYFPEEKVAAKACLSFEMCCAFERVNHIRIIDSDGKEKGLPSHIKRWCMEELFSIKPKGKFTYNKLKKKLDLSAHCSFKNIDPQSEKKEIFEPKIWRLECKQLSPELLEKMVNNLEFADEIDSALAKSNREDTLRERLRSLGNFNLVESEIDELCKLPFSSKNFSGYGKRSAKALQMLVGAFETYDENITSLYDAERVCGLDKKRNDSKANKGNILPPYQEYDPTNKNPVVLRVLAQVRKLVNTLIQEYGMPNRINIELARELKHSKKEKKQIAFANNKRGKEKDLAREAIAEHLGISEDSVTGKQLEKKMLWDEQKEHDLYLDLPIDYDRMLRDETYCQIDHILPYSRTCDNSQANKILVLAKSNQDKKQQTPYEWLSTLGKWEDFEKRVLSLKENIPYKKIQKLLEKDLPSKQESFIERNLNDTRYACRSAMNYLDTYLEFPEDDNKRHVFAVAGGATAQLRGTWGFVKKDREKDDLHHAIDAAVIAVCSPSAVIKVAKASEYKYSIRKEERKKLFRDTEPWPGFAEEVQERASEIIPTRRVDYGATGSLYQDSTYRFLGFNEKGKARLMKSGKESVSGNFVTFSDGSAKLPDGVMKLRLWWNGKKYLSEPIYYADIASIKDDTYIPKYCTSGKRREIWPEIPKEIIETNRMVELYYGKAVWVGSELLRYKRIDISGNTLKFASAFDFSSEITPKETLGKARDASFVQVVDEDILGLCYLSSMNQLKRQQAIESYRQH